MATYLPAARSSIRFAVPVLSGRAFGAGAFGIGLWPGGHGAMTTTMAGAARSSIVFGAQAPIEHEMAFGAATVISFSATGELIWTWASYAPCETGTWQAVDLANMEPAL